MSIRLGATAAVGVASVSSTIVALDLASKWVARRELTLGEDRWLLDGVVGMELVRNRGVAFGMLEGRGFTLVLILAAVLALIWLVAANGAGDVWTGPAGAGVMLGGAFGNLIDRLPDGSVTDFVAIGPWPRFNLADTALTLGVVLLAVQHLRESKAAASSLGETC